MLRTQEPLPGSKIFRASSLKTPRPAPSSPSSVSSVTIDPEIGLLSGEITVSLSVDPKANRTNRHHLDIHNPDKTSKYKCERCAYTCRYKKDVIRHNLKHEKPETPGYVCSQPGCNSKFYRNDNLRRHSRSAHQNSTSAQSTGTMANSHLGNSESSSADAHLPVHGAMDGLRETLRESSDSFSNHSAARASLGGSGFVVNRTPSLSTPQTADSSFNGYSDPLLRSPESASGYFCFSGTESPCPK